MTDEDRTEIKGIVQEAMNIWDMERRSRAKEFSLKQEQEPLQTKLYLITLSGHQIAFPDDSGRAVLCQCVFARVARRETDIAFHGGSVEVIAYGEGRRLKEPRKLILSGLSVVALVEVSEDLV